MPHAIRTDVRNYHMIKVYVSEPPKVKLVKVPKDQSEDKDGREEVEMTEVVTYLDSTFTKLHDFKVAPPLPSF